jgi:hypothetical protein
MGKRSPGFERVERDYYPTPYEAVLPLLPHLAPRTRFIEPCAGDGRLLRHLECHGHVCVDAFDIEPQCETVDKADALTVEIDARPGKVCITNMPWRRDFMHPFIDRWRQILPTWILCDADWMHTRQSAPFMPYCRKIISVGRVKWIEGSKMTGKDNAVWMLFDATPGQTLFFGR